MNFNRGDRFIINIPYGRKKTANVEIQLLKVFQLKIQPTWDADVVSVDGLPIKKPRTLTGFTEEYLSTAQKL